MLGVTTYGFPTMMSALTWAWLFNPVIGPLPLAGCAPASCGTDPAPPSVPVSSFAEVSDMSLWWRCPRSVARPEPIQPLINDDLPHDDEGLPNTPHEALGRSASRP